MMKKSKITLHQEKIKSKSIADLLTYYYFARQAFAREQLEYNKLKSALRKLLNYENQTTYYKNHNFSSEFKKPIKLVELHNQRKKLSELCKIQKETLRKRQQYFNKAYVVLMYKISTMNITNEEKEKLFMLDDDLK